MDCRLYRDFREEIVRSAWMACIVPLFCACAVGHIQSYPLYPSPEQPRPRESLARVEGPIHFIDGLDVESYGTAFDVLPGCHVVTLRHEVGDVNENGAWSADLGLLVYAFRMQAGRIYSIDMDVRIGSALHGTARLTARERDRAGHVLAMVPLVRSDRDIEACRAWEAGLHATSATPPRPNEGVVAGRQSFLDVGQGRERVGQE